MNLYYPVIHQTGFEIQLATGATLWKGETIRRRNKTHTFVALTTGLEHTFANLFATGADVALLLEYTFDERGNATYTGLNDDLFIATRFALNDIHGTNFTLAASVDRQRGSTTLRAEATRRITDKMTLSVAGHLLRPDPDDTFQYAFRNDSYLTLSLRRYL